MIIYLHGFRSGPQSWKSRALKARMDALGIGEAFCMLAPGKVLPVSETWHPLLLRAMTKFNPVS